MLSQKIVVSKIFNESSGGSVVTSSAVSSGASSGTSSGVSSAISAASVSVVMAVTAGAAAGQRGLVMEGLLLVGGDAAVVSL